MGDFKKNPDKPFEVCVPNKIRKRIASHERVEVSRQREVKSGLAKILSSPSIAVAPKRGSMWSRFTNKLKGFFNG